MTNDELKQLCDAATPGPWRLWSEPPEVRCLWRDGLPKGSVTIESTGTRFAFGVAVAAAPSERDAVFMVAARAEIPRLLAENEELRCKLANAEKHIEDDHYCAAHGVEACIECEGRCESCGYDALEEDMVTTDDGERLCVDCAAVDAEDAESPDARGEEKTK